jgi:hypothetical protein
MCSLLVMCSLLGYVFFVSLNILIVMYVPFCVIVLFCVFHTQAGVAGKSQKSISSNYLVKRNTSSHIISICFMFSLIVPFIEVSKLKFGEHFLSTRVTTSPPLSAKFLQDNSIN